MPLYLNKIKKEIGEFMKKKATPPEELFTKKAAQEEKATKQAQQKAAMTRPTGVQFLPAAADNIKKLLVTVYTDSVCPSGRLLLPGVGIYSEGPI